MQHDVAFFQLFIDSRHNSKKQQYLIRTSLVLLSSAASPIKKLSAAECVYIIGVLLPSCV